MSRGQRLGEMCSYTPVTVIRISHVSTLRFKFYALNRAHYKSNSSSGSSYLLALSICQSRLRAASAIDSDVVLRSRRKTQAPVID